MSEFKIGNAKDLTIEATSLTIVRDEFISFTVNGKRYNVSAKFTLDEIPESKQGLIVDIICKLRGRNIVGDLANLGSKVESPDLNNYEDKYKQESFFKKLKNYLWLS